MALSPVTEQYGVAGWRAQLVIPLLQNPPIDPIEGSVYLDTDDGRVYGYHNGQWNPSQIAALPGSGILFTKDPDTGLIIISVDPTTLPGGGGGGGGSYRHIQTTPATTWTIVHNLGYFPAVSVVDSSKRVVHGEIIYSADGQTVTLQFSSAFSGEAYVS